EKIDGTIIAQKALSAVTRTGQRFGISYLVDLLRGSRSQKIRDEHKLLKTYGVGADLSKEEWFAHFKDLVSQEFLAQTDGAYPTIVLTEKSDDVLKGRAAVELFKIEAAEVDRSKKEQPSSTPYITELFDQLRHLRLELSKNEGLPPYVVFSDATLVEMAAFLPQNESEMLRISGVGDLKLKKYGTVFLDVIRDYCDRNKLGSRIDLETGTRKPRSRTKRNDKGDDTFTVSLKMFRAGRSISEIAAERGLALSTIESHLARFVETGEVALAEVVPDHKIEPIRKALIELNVETAIGPVKELLGDEYSYGEIRAVAADFLRHNN
ncbi:MAG TPA: RQC domain-containing protein, partial [Pyrinomonadaceae bacterium]|nr:RQC domain-containing protein [Pyrinomonadaceae bacterium]